MGDVWYELQERQDGVAAAAATPPLSSGSRPGRNNGRYSSGNMRNINDDDSDGSDGMLDASSDGQEDLQHRPRIDDFDARSRRSRHSMSASVASFQLYTPDEERAVVRKFDRRLVLFLSLCYMLSFLDRSSKSLFPLDSDIHLLELAPSSSIRTT